MNRRLKFRQNLSPLYLPLYDQLCELLPGHWQPYQGYRTFAEQDKIYAQGRTAPGPIVSRAKGGESAHCWGCGSDWTLFDIEGKPIWLDGSDPAWQEYFDAIDKAGLKSGKSFHDVDHNELAIKCSWPAVLEEFKIGGMDAAQSFIKRMRS